LQDTQTPALGQDIEMLVGSCAFRPSPKWHFGSFLFASLAELLRELCGYAFDLKLLTAKVAKQLPRRSQRKTRVPRFSRLLRESLP
jgi:hypothetical protein